jgi:hypothetical protein
MSVEHQHVAVLRGQAAEFLGRLAGVAVARLAIRDVDHQGRVTVRLNTEKGLQIFLRLPQRLAHWCSSRGPGLKPNRELELLFDNSASAIVDFAGPHFHAQGVVRNLAHWNDGLAGQSAAKARGDTAAVTDDADVEKIANTIGLGALKHEVLQQAVERVGHASGLTFVRLTAERLQHGTGLVQ